MNRKIQRVTFNDFRGGVVQKNPVDFAEATDPQFTLAQNQLAVAKNVALWPDGSISQRSGIRQVANHPDGRDIVGMCLIPGTDSVVVVDRYDYSSGIRNDIKVLHVGYGSVPTSTWASPAAGVLLTMASARPAMCSYNGKGYVGAWGSPSGIREVVVTASLESVSAPFGPAVPYLLAIHNERLVAVDYQTPNVIQMSATGAPTDFANGVSVQVGQATMIAGIASLEDELWIFTDSGIFVLSGFTKTEMTLQRLETPYQNSNLSTKNSFIPGYLDGFGPCVFFYDQAWSPCAVSRRGVTKIIDGMWQKTNFGFSNYINSAFLSDTKQFISFSDGWDSLYSFFGGAPYQSPSGSKWGCSEFTPPPETDRLFPTAITSGFLNQSSVSQNKPVVLIGYETGQVYLYTQYGQDDYSDSGYSSGALDDFVLTAGSIGWYEPQAQIQLRPEHGGNGIVKHWTRAIVKLNKKGAGIYTAFYKLGDPVTSTVTGLSFANAVEVTADIDKHAQKLAFGINMFNSSAKSLSQILKQCIIRAITLEYEVES